MRALLRKIIERFLTVFLLIGAICLFPFAANAETEVNNPDLGKVFASVWRLRGEVFAQAKSAAPRKLQVGSTIYVGEQVRAAASSEAVLKTTDAGMIVVRPGAEFLAERFAAEGKSSDRQILRLITGSLRIISGWIGQINRNEHRVITPTATIGIRGTDHEPYVLPAEMANANYRQGTYDKVNRGSTALEAAGASLVVERGRVGFARDMGSVRTRALLTLLLPVLLDKVPEFYVPGSFDEEVDRYSAEADSHGRRLLERRNPGVKLPSATRSESGDVQPEPMATAEPRGTSSAASTTCAPKMIAEAWLGQFDGAIARRDVKTILGLFAQEIVATANVRSGERMTTLRFNREEMVQSMLASIASLKDYRQRRLSLEAALADGESSSACQQIKVKSVVIEQGLMNGKPYRFEALEDYSLELREGQWQAVRAETTQRF